MGKFIDKTCTYKKKKRIKNNFAKELHKERDLISQGNVKKNGLLYTRGEAQRERERTMEPQKLLV